MGEGPERRAIPPVQSSGTRVMKVVLTTPQFVRPDADYDWEDEDWCFEHVFFCIHSNILFRAARYEGEWGDGDWGDAWGWYGWDGWDEGWQW